MRNVLFIFLSIIFVHCSMAQSILPPDEIYGELFRDVQLGKIFPDSKTFVDCIPKRDPASILKDYLSIKNNPNVRFSLPLFVEENFYIPKKATSDYVTREKDIEKHINNLWTVLKRKSDSVIQGSSLLSLPYEYIIPGGRFREIYYWDTYFTMLGLKESGQIELMENMVRNFAYLIKTYGHVPNGNRSYYLSRSQPPFFSLFLDLLAEVRSEKVYTEYQEELEKEYNYWMDKAADTKHVVNMPDGSILNRYYDQLSVPRQEAYLEDVNVAHNYSPEHQAIVYRDLRTAAESGWDFSSRWLADGHSMATIQTTDIIPVDLNCLLYHIEMTLSRSYTHTGNSNKSNYFNQQAKKRKAAINKYCWSQPLNWYVDYNIRLHRRSAKLTLAGMFPFFLNVSSVAKCKLAKEVVTKQFLKAGGLVTTLINTGQQWDAPNGWAPLQWITIIGLENYKEKKLPREIATRWYHLNKRVFEATGKIEEKYNVVNANEKGGGGEYPSQDGFGWSNGVLIALIRKYNLK
jgi:alpha,alpha-trehalase